MAERTMDGLPDPGPSLGRAIGVALLGFRTLRHLTLRQLSYLPLRRIQMRIPARRPRVRGRVKTSREVPDPMCLFSTADTDRINNANQVLAGDFQFVGHTLNLNEVDWVREYCNPLWTYNLHYFDYAVDLALAYRSTGDQQYVARFAALVTGWLESATPGRGVGWHPYPLALRVVNWVHALLLLGDRFDPLMAARMERSLVSQAKWLRRRLEYHLDANHLQKNYKALAVLGLYFEGSESARWRSIGLRRCWHAALTHVLPDGMHYERSPMYHAIVLRDFLEVIAWADGGGQHVPDRVRQRVARMIPALAALSRSDGTFHLFNDTANGIGPGMAELDRLGASVLGVRASAPRRHVRLPDAGFFGFVDQDKGLRLLIDAGAPGPSHQPAHAHCGILGMELDVYGDPIIVDSGVSGYVGDPLRSYFRSTRAHSTVMIDGKEQSEVWSVFRMARRARMIAASDRCTGAVYRFGGSYQVYHSSAVHRRRIIRAGDSLRVTDRVDRAMGSSLKSFVHFHPDCVLKKARHGIAVTHGGRTLTLRCFGVDTVEVAHGGSGDLQGWYAPRFGDPLPAPVVGMRVSCYDGRRFGFELGWGG